MTGLEEFPFNSEEEFELILGESFLSTTPNTGFHTVRYDFKPASVDVSQPGNLEVGAGGEVNVSLHNTQDSGVTAYKGSYKPCPKECILVVDKRKRTITLERLTSAVQLKKIRSAPTTSKLNNSQANSQQNDMNIAPEEQTTQNKMANTVLSAEDSSGSDSSSSESDSDVEDEEVAKLNATLIGQTNNSEANPKGETSSSYNQICKDLELSESGSDSD